MFLYFSTLLGVNFLNSVILFPPPGLLDLPLLLGDYLVFDLLLPIFIEVILNELKIMKLNI